MTEPLTMEQIREQVNQILREGLIQARNSALNDPSVLVGVFTERIFLALQHAGLLAMPGEQDVDERHIINYDENGMTMMHPLSCRPNLFACPVWNSVKSQQQEPPHVLGKFYCGLDAKGEFKQYEQVPQPEGVTNDD